MVKKCNKLVERSSHLNDALASIEVYISAIKQASIQTDFSNLQRLRQNKLTTTQKATHKAIALYLSLGEPIKPLLNGIEKIRNDSKNKTQISIDACKQACNEVVAQINGIRRTSKTSVKSK